MNRSWIHDWKKQFAFFSCVPLQHVKYVWRRGCWEEGTLRYRVYLAQVSLNLWLSK
jgi:hypothetical protein